MIRRKVVAVIASSLACSGGGIGGQGSAFRIGDAGTPARPSAFGNSLRNQATQSSSSKIQNLELRLTPFSSSPKLKTVETLSINRG